jgi:hypothetical protein
VVAVPEINAPGPAAVAGISSPFVRARHRRLVAVAETSMELLRPESDLARLCRDADHVDLLIACDDSASDVDEDPDCDDFEGFDDGDGPVDEISARIAELGLPTLALHRLGLGAPLAAQAEDDLVAALSELVGFDPEQGVYCLAPAPAPADPARTAVDQAARRIALVYGIPLLRYRCLELSVVPSDG